MRSCARLTAMISLVSLASLAACASPAPPPSAPASPEPASTAPIATPSPNDCGSPGSARPCAGPSSEPKEPARKMCTEMACLDGVTIAHRLGGAELAKGKHTFEIDADGAKTTCAVTVTDLGADAHVDCADRVSLSIAPKSETTVAPPKAGAGPDAPVVATRTVVPNSTEWRVHLEGKTPKALRIVHKLGTKTVADHKLAPKYEQRQPNGKGCEPTCSQANETVP